MQLTVVGCGDAFGSGGRLQTCFHVKSEETNFLVDCGATALIGLQQCKIDPNDVSTIFVSHLHGDHYSGLVWWMLHAQHVAKRTLPLTIVGPQGLKERFLKTSELLFPGALQKDLSFQLEWLSYCDGGSLNVGPISIMAVEVSHPCGATPYALRLETGGKTLSFSGDTEWVDGLVDIARGCDLYISECFSFSSEVRFHMDWKTIERKLSVIDADRIMLTHMGPEMLAQLSQIDNKKIIMAEDGLVVDL